MDADGNRSNTQNDGEKQDGHKAARFFLGWLVALNKGITKLLKKALGPDYIAVTEDEVLDMVNALAQTPDDDGDGENVIEESSAQMINNIFEFKDLTAGDVMTHRTNIVGVDMSVSLDDIIYLALDMGFSRIPVYEGSIDRIVGIIIVKDLLCLVGKSQADLDGFDIHDFVRSVNFVPESCPCSEVFKSLTSLKSGMAVVADEYGGTAGIVTLEDIIEAVMGNIQDEYDDERSEIVKVGEDEYDIDGEADPDEVFRLFGVELPEERLSLLYLVDTGELHHDHVLVRESPGYLHGGLSLVEVERVEIAQHLSAVAVVLHPYFPAYSLGRNYFSYLKKLFSHVVSSYRPILMISSNPCCFAFE